ncbi:46 kDa FK506-binding nuclear protein [Thrips palmi]|uniref:FK506-binding protein n=1 Tax=Thrips palmi TaxID=161013 RepID=A0A6P8YXP3_THRPL|nr:46 kDa FK506-binding nuclear protein [Thrips palmi]
MSFWGLILEPKKSYTQRGVEQPFHVSSAALDLQTCDDGPVSVVCRKSDQDFILCSLSKSEGIYNVPLNLDFEIGSEITFHVVGDSTVHLTGYIVDEMELDDDDSSLDELEEEEDESNKVAILKNTKKLLDAAAAKRKPESSVQNKSKKAKVEVQQDEDDDDDEDDSDFEGEETMDGDEDLGEEEEEDDDDDDEEEEDDDDDDEEEDEDDGEAAEVLKKLQAMKENKAKQGKNQQPAKGLPQNAKQGKKEQAKGQNQTNKQNGAPQSNGVSKKTITGGIQIEELQLGNGPAAANNKQVSVYYVGRLKSNNKQFDACQSGPGFRFKLGKGEVIKGWDLGVAGMKVGGKRRLTIPAKMAYGQEGAGKTIPPNSTLVFDVELRHVK